MKHFAISIVLGLLLSASVLVAQDTTSSGKSKAKVRTVAGWLAQGGSTDKFVLNGNDGSTWDVSSDSVSLADDLGDTITAKGTLSYVTMHNAKEEAKDAASDAGMSESNNQHGDMTVSSVKMVRKSCQQ